MSNLEYIERILSSDGDLDQRLERIRLHLADGFDHVDPELADKLRRYSKTDLVCFIDHIIKHYRGKLS